MRLALKDCVPYVESNLSIVPVPDWTQAEVISKDTIILNFDDIYIDDITCNKTKVETHTAEEIETLKKQRIELPAYSELDRLIRSIRHQVNQDIFTQVHKSLPKKIKNKFSTLTANATRTAFDRIKDLPKNTTVTHVKELTGYRDW